MAAERALEFSFTPEDGEEFSSVPGWIPYESRQRTEVHRHKVRVTRRRSAYYTVEEPLDYVSSRAASLKVNGLTAPESTQVPNRKATAQVGKVAVSMGLYRDSPLVGFGSVADLMRTERTRQEGVLSVIEDFNKRYGDDVDIDLEGQSTGGRTVTAVALAAPDRVKSVKLVNSAGTIKGQNTFDYLNRLSGFHRHEISPNTGILRHHFRRAEVVGDFIWYNLGDLPFLVAEAISISNDDIRDKVIALAAMKRVKTAIVDTAGDFLTPNAGVEDDLGKYVDHYVRHPNPFMGHLAVQAFAVETALLLHDVDRALDPDVLPARQFPVVPFEQRAASSRARLHASHFGQDAA